MSLTSKYRSRGYRGKDYMCNLKDIYRTIISYASDSQNELDIQYRDNYINIYYMGGSLLKLSGKGKVEFDENYFYNPNEHEGYRITDVERLAHEDYMHKASESKELKNKPEAWLSDKHLWAKKIKKELKEKRNEIIHKLLTSSEVTDTLEEMKYVMNRWKINLQDAKIRKDIVNERVVQHYISLFNKESQKDSDYIVIDLEYAISGNANYRIPDNKKLPNKKQPRIDIIAIEKGTGRLYVMELKYGLESTDGNAGVRNHYEDFINSVGSERWKEFMNDIEHLYISQVTDGTLTGNTKLDTDNKPIFAFVFKPKTVAESLSFKDILRQYDLIDVPTFMLPVENNYANPNTQSHLLKKL